MNGPKPALGHFVCVGGGNAWAAALRPSIPSAIHRKARPSAVPPALLIPGPRVPGACQFPANHARKQDRAHRGGPPTAACMVRGSKMSAV